MESAWGVHQCIISAQPSAEHCVLSGRALRGRSRQLAARRLVAEQPHFRHRNSCLEQQHPPPQQQQQAGTISNRLE